MVNINSQQQSTVQKVLESAILQNQAFDIHDTLPNVLPDLTSLDMVTDYTCPAGEVVVAPYCGMWKNSKAIKNIMNSRRGHVNFSYIIIKLLSPIVSYVISNIKISPKLLYISIKTKMLSLQ